MKAPVTVLVVDHNAAERDATVRLLPPELYEVTLARDGASALTILRERDFDVVLAESTLPGVTAAAMVKQIRTRDAHRHTYVIFTAALPVQGDIRLAFGAGADDFVRKPLGRDELQARVDAPTRIRRWTSRTVASGTVQYLTAGSELVALSAWTTLETTVAAAISEMLGMTLSATTTTEGLEKCLALSTLPLSLATESAEVGFAVGIGDDTAAELTETLFGAKTTDPEAIRDMLGEIVNVAAGAFKRVAAAESRDFTTGIPKEAQAHEIRHAGATARRQWIVAAEGTSIALRFEVELRVREKKRLPVAALREGMIIATDLANDAGALLIRQGTRITESHLSGIVRAVGDLLLVEVFEAR